MTASVHRALVALGFLATSVGGLLEAPGWEPLGIPVTVGLGFVLAGSVLGFASTAWRQATDKNV